MLDHARKMAIKRTLKLADARKEAKVILGRVAKGNDPLAERRKAQVSAAPASIRCKRSARAIWSVKAGCIVPQTAP